MRINSHHPYAILTIFSWALAFPLTRLALRHFTPLPLGFLRYILASAGMAVIAAAMGLKPPKAADVKWFLLSGATGFFIYVSAFNKGSATVAAALGSVVIATAPVLTALLAWFFYGERLSAVKWLAIAAEFSGVALLALMNGGGLSLNPGVLWIFAAALSFSVYNILQRRLTRSYEPIMVTAYSMFAGAAMLAAVFSRGAAGELTSAPPPQLLALGVMAVLSSAIAYVSWTKAIAKAQNTANVSNYMFLTPFLAAIMAYIITGETIEPSKAAGGSAVLIGVFLFNFGDKLLAARRGRK